MSKFTAAILFVSAIVTLAADAAPAKQRGMSFAAANPRRGTYGSPASEQSLRELKALHVDWISLMPFGFHRGAARLSFGGEHVWETDASLLAAATQAHELGIRVMLKPHVWGREEQHMERWSDAEWQTIAPLTGAADAATLRTYRDRYREGIPRRPIADEEADARILYRVLAAIGGRELVGPAQELDSGTFYHAIPGD